MTKKELPAESQRIEELARRAGTPFHIYDGRAIRKNAEDMMKERIRSDLKKALNGYKTLMEMRDGDDDMTVYLSMQNEEVISEMVLVSDSEMALIFIAGDMPVSELQRIIAEVAEEQ